MTPDEEGRSSFVRGMTIGAIIGAIVAGSSLWSRRRRERRVADRLASGELLGRDVVEPGDDPSGGSSAPLEVERD